VPAATCGRDEIRADPGPSPMMKIVEKEDARKAAAEQTRARVTRFGSTGFCPSGPRCGVRRPALRWGEAQIQHRSEVMEAGASRTLESW